MGLDTRGRHPHRQAEWKELPMKPGGHAAHVDSVDSLRQSPLPTIACTTLRVAHMPTGPTMTGFRRAKQQRRNIAGEKGYELD